MATHTINATDTFTIGGDLTVNRLGFGAMRLTGEGIWGEPKDPAEAKRVLRRAVELGINFIDTADAYGPAVSECLIGETLYPYPESLVIATEGRTDTLRTEPMESAGQAGVSAAVRRDEFSPSEIAAHRPLPVAPHRSQGSGRRSVWRTGEDAAGR